MPIVGPHQDKFENYQIDDSPKHSVEQNDKKNVKIGWTWDCSDLLTDQEWEKLVVNN